MLPIDVILCLSIILLEEGVGRAASGMVAPRINCVHTRFSYNTHISKMGSQMSFALLVATVASHQLFHCSNHGILSRVLMSM